MLSPADIGVLNTARDVLTDVRAVATNRGKMDLPGPELLAWGQLKGYAIVADTALQDILTLADTYLDDVHDGENRP